MKQALLVIDMLNDFVLEGAPLEVPAARQILPALKKHLTWARHHQLPVVFVCDAHAPDDREFERMGWPPHAVRGTDGAKVVSDLVPQLGEAVVSKKSYSGFWGTDLETVLKKLGVQQLILTGCVTNICILYTAFEAVVRGYRVRVPVDAVAALDGAEGEFALRQMENVLGVELYRP